MFIKQPFHRSGLKHPSSRRGSSAAFNFNSDSKYASHKLVSASSGYISSLGFNSKVKPELLMAAWAANVLCQ